MVVDQVAKSDDLDDRELRAAAVIQVVLNDRTWELEPRDVKSAPAGTHDFDLCSGNQVVAVEESTLSDGRSVGDHAAWDTVTEGGVVHVDGLDNGWIVSVDLDGRATQVVSGLGEWLHLLEQNGVTQTETRAWQQHLFSPPAHRPPTYGALRAMAAAGITMASVSSGAAPGTCVLMVTWAGDQYDPLDRTLMPRFVSDQLASSHRADIEKLQRAAARHRVLFLWLDAYSYFQVARSLDHGDPTGGLKNVGALNEVWIGRNFKDGSVTVYRWQESEGWARHDLEAAPLNRAISR